MKRAPLWAVLLVLAGCGSEVVSLARGPRDYTETDYEDVYERWTRSEETFSWATLSDVLRVSATYESWEFRWAYVVRYAHDHSMDVAERDAMLRATLADAEQNHRFVVSLQGERFRESILTGRLSAWRVLLVDEAGQQTVPVEIQRFRRPTAAQIVYFPQITPQRAAFRISFPTTQEDGTPTIPAGTTSLKLRFAGPRGRVDLVWRLRDVEAGTSGGAVGTGETVETIAPDELTPVEASPGSDSGPADAGTPPPALEVRPEDARGL